MINGDIDMYDEIVDRIDAEDVERITGIDDQDEDEKGTDENLE